MSDRVFVWPPDKTDSWGPPNPHYDPDACGLALVASLEDPNASYSFDGIHVWRDVATGELYAAHDAGCSCPTPFEDYHKLSDMERIRSLDELKAFVASHNQYDTWPVREVDPFLEKVEAALKAKP